MANGTDLNDVVAPKKYFLSGFVFENAFTTDQIRGILEVINCSIGIVQRITVAYPTAKMYIRGRWNGMWESWVEL